MKAKIHVEEAILGHPLMGLVGSFTGIARSIQETLLDYDEPEIYNVIIEASESQRQTTPYIRAGGAGITLREAMDRGIGEFIERYSLLAYGQFIQEDILHTSFRELSNKGITALNPTEILLFSESQYRKKGFPFKKTTEETWLGWAKGISLLSMEEIYVPAQLIYMGYQRRENEPLICPTTTSGAAMGDSYVTATLNGIYETIERDAIMRVWYTMSPPPRLMFEHSSRLKPIINRIEEKGFSYYLFLVPHETEIYVTLGIGIKNDEEVPKFVIGGSASLSIVESCYKALLECAQGVPFVKMLSLIFHKERIDLKKIDDFDKNVAFYGNPKNFKHVMFLLSSKERVDIIHLEDRSMGSPENDLKRIVFDLRRKQIETIVFDATPPNLAEYSHFRVVKIYCPHLISLPAPSYPFLANPRLTLHGKVNPMPHPYP